MATWVTPAPKADRLTEAMRTGFDGSAMLTMSSDAPLVTKTRRVAGS